MYLVETFLDKSESSSILRSLSSKVIFDQSLTCITRIIEVVQTRIAKSDVRFTKVWTKTFLEAYFEHTPYAYVTSFIWNRRNRQHLLRSNPGRARQIKLLEFSVIFLKILSKYN